jgi:hypothetical protein
VGARLRFAFRHGEAEAFDGEMLAFDPASLLVLRWGDEVLRFEVSPDGGGTVLVFTTTFDEFGKAARDGAAWHSCLDVLTFELARERAPWSALDRWKLLRASTKSASGPRRRRSDHPRNSVTPMDRRVAPSCPPIARPPRA